MSPLRPCCGKSYQRFEIVIVNDGPNPATRAAIERLGDARIRFVEFPEQQRYPADRHLRWMVAGAPGMNRAAELATGSWLAPLDDDDEFSDDHLEKLLAAALDARAELAHGAIVQKHVTRGEEYRISKRSPGDQSVQLHECPVPHVDWLHPVRRASLGCRGARGLEPDEADARRWRIDRGHPRRGRHDVLGLVRREMTVVTSANA